MRKVKTDDLYRDRCSGNLFATSHTYVGREFSEITNTQMHSKFYRQARSNFYRFRYVQHETSQRYGYNNISMDVIYKLFMNIETKRTDRVACFHAICV